MKKHVIFIALTMAMVLALCGSVSATDINATPLTDYSNIYVKVANDEGVSYNTTGNDTYYIQHLSAPNGGFNAIHIANDSSTTLNYGGSTNSTNQTGTFYATDTGGRGYQDDVVLMVAVNGTIPDNFALHLTVYGYNWTPYGYNNCPQPSEIGSWGITLDETFTKEDFIYGLQNWKPTGGNSNYSIFIGENMSDPNNMFYIMFIDLHAGMLGSNYKYGSNSQFINNGAVQINYTFENLLSFAAFNIYAWNWNTTQGQGMLWTNSILPGQTGGPSGYTVQGTPGPAAAFTYTPTTPLVNQPVQFTDHSTGSTPITYSWNFGDGSTSTLQNPTHTYTTNGTYLVRLNITNALGSNQVAQYVTISNLLVSSSVPSGLYNNSLNVNLTSTDPLAQIYYTTNGTDPTTGSTHYTGPISITNEGVTTLKYLAVDGSSSATGSNVYTIDKTAPTVTASPGGGTYHTAQNITLNTTDYSTTTTYYTADGTDPTVSSNRTVYSNPIPVYTSTTLKYAALDAAGNWSPVYTQIYNMVSTTPPAVSADTVSGNYTTNLNVYLTATDPLDPDPKIYYTLNGTDPTINSTPYEKGVPIDTVGTTILKFFAVNYAGLASNIFTSIYNLDKAPVSGTWSSNLLDSNNIKYNSIVVDSSGYVHIAYSQDAVSGNNPQLKYAYQDASGWHIETVETSQSGSGYWVSLALDSLGNPHLAYEDVFGGAIPYSLRYAYRDGTGWHISVLSGNYSGNIRGDMISAINLLLYQDQPRICYLNGTSYNVEYMYLNGTTWVREDAAIHGGPCISMVLDADGNPKLSFYSISPQSQFGSLRYAERGVNGTWTTTIVDHSAPYVGMSNSLALDSEGIPHIAYTWDNSSEFIVDVKLKYAYWDGVEWVTEDKSISDLNTGACKLIIDASNTPLVIYQDATSSHLEYAYKQGSNWVPITIDTVNKANKLISLALNPSGVPYVSYSTTSYNLKYGYLQPFTVNATLSGGTYNQTQTVAFTSTPGTTVYYTTDGTDPRTSTTKTKYTAPLSVKNTTTFRFAAVDNATNWSAISTETYIILNPVTNNRTGTVYNTIQEAIDSQNTTSGDTLFVNPGNYIENVFLNKTLVLTALGLVYINPANTNLPALVITSNASGSLIQGFIINGTVNNSGVSFDSANNVTLVNNTITGNYVGVKLWNSGNNTISNNTVSGNGWSGICLDTSNGNKITGNTLTGNQEAVFIANSSHNNISSNNALNNIYNGISLISGSNQNTITQNLVQGNGVMGIFIQNSLNNTVSNNRVFNNSWTGICLDGATGNNITGNNVTGNQEGIFAANSAAGNRISQNTLSNNHGNGVNIIQGTGNTVTNNTISNNGVIGIFVQLSSSTTVNGNLVAGNGWSGICLDRATLTNITGNNVTANQEGLFIVASDQNIINFNNVTGNTYDGISILQSSNSTLKGNSVKNNTYSGVFIQNSSQNTIQSNTFSANGWSGVCLDHASGTNATLNNFVNNPEQALAVGGSGNSFNSNYWSDWNTTYPRPIDGDNNITDSNPKTIPY
ncbi:chitobiase/beta-hexosaminidase C-terminal domain-containing protein [uncultured Methanobacterium sp.]|uniref:chitobiase/beta-hexosaminidase C-terminal domain-containing protein n=1 Tax=uncultured Methanobacterium sp. TaxID=176306 RepID=UPI002AA753CB|nr:chitobiase/beta-hexosaminidase C-terminal domain-containing protein [uncultured Methanobacterium sp.]